MWVKFARLHFSAAILIILITHQLVLVLEPDYAFSRYIVTPVGDDKCVFVCEPFESIIQPISLKVTFYEGVIELVTCSICSKM